MFLGTGKDNSDDAIQKNRRVISTGEALSDLTEQQVLTIRQLVEEGAPQTQVARQYNIGKNAVWNIVHRLTWRHI